MDKLLAQQAKAQQKLHKAEMDDKKIKKQIADLQRNERTHRLCTRGAYLEKLLIEPELFTDEDVFRFLDYAFGTLYVKDELMRRLEKKRKEAKAAAEKQAAEAAKAEEKVARNPIEKPPEFYEGAQLYARCPCELRSPSGPAGSSMALALRPIAIHRGKPLRRFHRLPHYSAGC